MYEEPVYSCKDRANLMLPRVQSYGHDVLRVFNQDWSVKPRGAWRDIADKLVKDCNLFRINMLCKIQISDSIITYLITAIGFPLGGSSSYTSTDKTNKSKYT